MTLCRPIRGGEVHHWARGTRPGVLDEAVCPLLKTGRPTPLGTMTTTRRGQGAAQVNKAGIDRLDVEYESGTCQMSMKKIHMGRT